MNTREFIETVQVLTPEEVEIVKEDVTFKIPGKLN